MIFVLAFLASIHLTLGASPSERFVATYTKKHFGAHCWRQTMQKNSNGTIEWIDDSSGEKPMSLCALKDRFRVEANSLIEGGYACWHEALVILHKGEKASWVPYMDGAQDMKKCALGERYEVTPKSFVKGEAAAPSCWHMALVEKHDGNIEYVPYMDGTQKMDLCAFSTKFVKEKSNGTCWRWAYVIQDNAMTWVPFGDGQYAEQNCQN